MARAEIKESVGPAARMAAAVAKRLRMKKGLTQEQLGQQMGFTGAAISAMERLLHPVSDDMLVHLERVLGGGTGIFEEMRELVRLEKLPEQFRGYAPIEQKAVALCLYANHVVHGLFQTEGYARALISGGHPEPTPERAEELVVGRMARKALFDRKPVCEIELVLDESVLRRPIGSEEILREQLAYLADCARRRNVNLQVLPLDAGLEGEYAGDRGDLNIIETPAHDHVTYLEIQRESLLITDRTKVSMHTQQYAKIRAQALDPRRSLGVIEELAGVRR
ncbi:MULTISPECIES: helix-turn-helix transcriptional regulator [unclassified Streptomyces]|uniref:helix-turn-helix domain-containing protein n=1 Tax=unclassified Streptomyces TaxID=2593676 RepID=UPI0006FC47CB|nr:MULTISPECIES: helix-turn-helix transcriptional regulator [unclassified Streptomyces]KQX45528.1 DNA-binding protein [Streptomyces sp. Root1304]KRA79472.1 DNA-binding protein [Streptomyces sp. Root66D1]